MNKTFQLFVLMLVCVPIWAQIDDAHYERLMNMDRYSFDQTDSGWRQFQDRELQLKLIYDYIERSNSKSTTLKWHLGQLYALTDQSEEAIAAFEVCRLDNPETPGQRAWNYYVGGSIAFLKKDESTFDLYLDSLKNNEEQMNLEVMQRLKDNFDKPYKEAY